MASVMEELCEISGEEDYLAVLDTADNFATTHMLSDFCQCMTYSLISASVIHWMGYAAIFCAEVPSYRAVFPDIGQNMQDCRTAGVLGPVVGLIGLLQAQLCLSHILRVIPSPGRTAVSLECKNNADEFVIVIDVRSFGEKPTISYKNLHFVPLDHLIRLKKVDVKKDKRVVLCCQSGLRSARAAILLYRQGYKFLALLAVKHQ
ncbi:ThiF family adenylyltransferase [Bombella favorum]|uniref:ThiF family adenylyltransferase n=1 Tax=Bombella favorum TaxID=2039164 RepID=UPI0038991B54